MGKGWLARDPDIRKHNQEVVDATERMVKEVIPSLVKEELESLRARDQEMYLDWVCIAKMFMACCVVC